MFFTPAADELRAFLRDTLRLPYTDTGDGWLIFHPPAAEIGCHPSQRRSQGLSFYCEDLPETMATLQRRGVEFSADIAEQDWGWVTRFRIPGGDEVELYQPKYSTRRRRDRRAGRSPQRRRAGSK